MEESKSITRLLMDSDYSIELLLKRAQENNLNLKQLRDQLVEHQQNLQKTSTEIFNNSYDKFFKLSQLINCLAEPIQNVINPIENYRNRLSQLCQDHDKYLREIDSKLIALEETSRNKLYANRFIALIMKRDRIFNQLNQLEWLKMESRESIIEESNKSIEGKVKYDTIERLAYELDYLSHEVQAIQPTSDELISIKKDLQSSIDEQQTLLDWPISSFKRFGLE
jgi:hypothetical protein